VSSLESSLTSTLPLGESTLLTHAELLLRLTVALVLGGIIGFERELRNKPAGLRTIVLIAAGLVHLHDHLRTRGRSR
jgi:uncharacterized membrane protein YhiD involved in acid resistance